MSDLATQGNMPEILALESWIKANVDQEPLLETTELNHYRIPGVYARELKLKAGTILTGKIHNFESLGILSQGRMRILTSEGAKIVEAPYVTVDKPGIKRLGVCETDCTFVSIHRTDAETIEDIEDELVSDTFEQFELKRLGRSSV